MLNSMLILIDLYNENYKLWRYPEEYVHELQHEFPEVDFRFIKNKDDYNTLLPDADAIIGWRLLEEDFPRAENLKWYHTMAAGIGTMFYDDFVNSSVVLTNSAGVRADPMADCIMTYIILLARRFPMLIQAQSEKQWARYDYWQDIQKVVDLDLATVGIIGLGGIGIAVAKRAKTSGMNVIGVKRHLDGNIENVDELYPHDKLHEVLAISDFVVLTLPHTQDTDKIIGVKEFEIMKSSAYIINVGRGKLIDTQALINALDNGEIAGAALDVTDPEPPPQNSPLWHMDNVILTPHISGIGPNFWKRSQPLVKINIEAFLNDKPMMNIVDKNLQY